VRAKVIAVKKGPAGTWRFQVHMPLAWRARLKAAAKQDQRSVAFWLRQAVEEKLERERGKK